MQRHGQKTPINFINNCLPISKYSIAQHFSPSYTHTHTLAYLYIAYLSSSNSYQPIKSAEIVNIQTGVSFWLVCMA